MEHEMQARRVLEAASWRLVSEIVRRHPEIRVAEMQFGGGQSDSLVLLRPGRNTAPICDFNRPGSMHVFARFDGHDVPVDERMWLGIWAEWTNDESVSGDSLRRVVREVERRVGLVGPSHMPATDHATLTYRVIAALTSAALFNLESVEVRNGFLDSSGGWGGPREELFTRFPAMASRRAAHLDDDPLGQPAYRFWFVLRGTEPVLALEPASGLCWQLRKDSVDLMGLYRENGRRLWPVVVAVGSDVIEP